MAGCGLLSAARSGCLYEHLQLRGLTSRQRQQIRCRARRHGPPIQLVESSGDAIDDVAGHHAVRGQLPTGDRDQRSEEHTSELQSQSNLVCRLLLEKKKNSNSLLITLFIIYCANTYYISNKIKISSRKCLTLVMYIYLYV